MKNLRINESLTTIVKITFYRLVEAGVVSTFDKKPTMCLFCTFKQKIAVLLEYAGVETLAEFVVNQTEILCIE